MTQAESVHSTPRRNSPTEDLSNVVRLLPAYDDDTDDDCSAIIQYAELLCIISASGDVDGVDMPLGVNRLLWVISDHAKAIQARNAAAGRAA